MNGIIHLIAFDRSEYWIDGDPVDSIFLEGFNNPARFGRGVTITYKNGEEIEMRKRRDAKAILQSQAQGLHESV